MKTVKALKITSILNGIFCFFCIASTVCFAIAHYQVLAGDQWRTFFSIANISDIWMGGKSCCTNFIRCMYRIILN